MNISESIDYLSMLTFKHYCISYMVLVNAKPLHAFKLLELTNLFGEHGHNEDISVFIETMLLKINLQRKRMGLHFLFEWKIVHRVEN